MPTPTADELARFALPGLLRFESGEGALRRAVVSHPAAAGEMYLHGAHVTGWQPRGRDPVLFMSQASWFERDRPIRGGVPICFPWFGPKTDDPDAPSHGLARTRSWQVTDTASDDAGVAIEMAAIIEPFRVTYRVTFGAELRLRLRIENAGGDDVRFEEALHTYFRVGDVRQIEVAGLEDASYLDKMRGGQRIAPSGEPIRFTGETDRVYLGTSADCVLRDPVLGRSIRVRKERSDATVVWNPWIDKAARLEDFGDDEWPGMVCIETGNVADDAVTLPAGAAHEMTAVITIE